MSYSRQINNRGYLKGRRKYLRNHLTSAEATLWRELKGKKLYGLKFRRQHSIENYIVDFYCASHKLIIELDGQIHDNSENELCDAKRDKRLEELGFQVLRFENSIVFNHPETIFEEVKRHIVKY